MEPKRRGRPPLHKTVHVEPKEAQVVPESLPLTPIEAFIARMSKLKKAQDDKFYK